MRNFKDSSCGLPAPRITGPRVIWTGYLDLDFQRDLSDAIINGVNPAKRQPMC